MNASRIHSRGFTLIELIMVMVIVAIMAAVAAPELQGFMIGRRTNDQATQIMNLAAYARNQSIAEGRVYRLNFDTSSGQYWLTYQSGADFKAANGDYGKKYQSADRVKMDVQGTPQYSMQSNTPANIQQTAVQGNAPIDQPGLTTNQLMQNVHDDSSTYIEFQPSGRCDTVDIKLTDALGHVVEVACSAATETFRIVKKDEVR